MSDHDEVMGKLAQIEAQNKWLVSAVKHLLSQEIDGVEHVEEWLGGLPDVVDEDEDMSQYEHLAIRNPPKPKTKPCPHNQQGVVNGRLKCVRCGHIFGSSGVVQNKVASDGRVIADPNPPQWATEHSPGASSKNPGTPLVPHSS